MITSPGLNPILNTHTDMDETFGTDISQKLFLIRKGHNFHSLTTQWGKIDKYCWRLQQYLRFINLGLAIETELKKVRLIYKNRLNVIIKSKAKQSRRQILEDKDEEVQKAINNLRNVLNDLKE
jgi:hypothetical protein